VIWFASQNGNSTASIQPVLLEIESLRKKLNLNRFLKWCRELGIGLTPLLELPKEVNPYLKDGIRIHVKLEYLNPSGSGKDRPVSFMLYYYNEIGLLNKVKRITTAGFGNFIKSLSFLLPRIGFNIQLESFMGNALIEENIEFAQFLKKNGVVIHTCEDGYCPTTNSARGKAVTWAYIEEKADLSGETLFLDQHGYHKPENGLLNAAGYYYTLAPEILHQTKEADSLYYVNGEGTRGSLMGTGVGLKTKRSDVTIIGLTQTEGGHIFGLRSKRQLGKSETLGKAESLCNSVFEISDREAFETMVRLWEVGIPSSPSGGGYVAGALRVAKELSMKGREGTIITLIFDSLELYSTILSIWMPKILKKDFKMYRPLFYDLKDHLIKERMAHTYRVRSRGSLGDKTLSPSTAKQ